MLLCQESLIPYAKKQLKLAKMSFDLFGALSPSEEPGETAWRPEDTKKTDGEQRNSSSCRQVSQVEVEGSQTPYEGTFEDYLEMFIQFGYVTLFSSAYPLAGLCALLNNLIEVRSDAFKLCFIHQRPFTQRVQVRTRWEVEWRIICNLSLQNIGCWQTAMEVMGVIGVLVNCALIGEASQLSALMINIKLSPQVCLVQSTGSSPTCRYLLNDEIFMR